MNTIVSKKGVSPILATLLLIIIAVTAVVVTYAWILSFTGTQTAGVMLTQENVSWPTASTIEVTIRNIGTSDARIIAVYLGTLSTNLNLGITISPPLGSSSAIVEAGSTNTFTITYQWATNTKYYFKFETDTPESLDFSEQSPQL